MALLQGAADAGAADAVGYTPLTVAAAVRPHGRAAGTSHCGARPQAPPPLMARPPSCTPPAGSRRQLCSFCWKPQPAVDIGGEDGATPLHYAARGGSAACVARLLGAGAAVEARDRWGASALQLAEEASHSEAAAVLRTAGASSQPCVIAQSRKNPPCTGRDSWSYSLRTLIIRDCPSICIIRSAPARIYHLMTSDHDHIVDLLA